MKFGQPNTAGLSFIAPSEAKGTIRWMIYKERV